MCLFSLTPIPSIAQEDIICYKVFNKIPLHDEILMTPYQLAVVFLKDFPFLFKAFSSYKRVYPIYGDYDQCVGYSLGPGFIHAYTEIPYLLPHQCAVLCKILKGTKYYVSWTGAEVCAGEIELIKVLR